MEICCLRHPWGWLQKSSNMFSEALRKAPLLRVVVPFAAGIVMGTLVPLPCRLNYIAIWVMAFALLTATSYWLSSSYRWRWLFGAVLTVCLFITGCWYYSLYKDQVFSRIPVEGKGAYMAEVLMHEKVTPSFNVYTVSIEEQAVDNEFRAVHAKVRLYLPLDDSFSGLLPGDRLIIRGALSRPKDPSNPGEFNYRRYLERKGIWGVGYVRDAQAVSKMPGTGGSRLKRVAALLQNKFTGLFRAHGIQGDDLALLSALTIGVRDEIDNDMNQAFSASGAMHVLSVSGLHVGIVYLVLARLLAFGAGNRFMRIPFLILQIGFLWFYAFLTGLSPAVNRAAAMFSFLAVGKSLKRQAGTTNVLSGSALILLLVNPFMIFDIGFQLSYLAVFFISVLQPLIYGLIEAKSYFADQVWKLIALSLAAQAGTFPLSVMYFNQFPNYFLVTNLVVVPLAAIILYLSIAMLLLSWIPLLGPLLAFLLRYSLKGMIGSVEAIENLPYSVLHNIHLSGLQAAWLYLIILLLVFFFSYRRREFLFAGMAGFIIFLLSATALKIHSFTRETFTVFNRQSSSIIMFSTHGAGYVFCTGNAMPKAATLSRPYAVELGLGKLTLIDLDTLRPGTPYSLPGFGFSAVSEGVVLFHDKHCTALYLHGGGKVTGSFRMGTPVDYVIIGKVYIRSNRGAQFAFPPGVIIIDSSVPPWEIESASGELPGWIKNPYRVAVKGAFSVVNRSFSVGRQADIE